MKHLKKILITSFVGILVTPIVANAETIIPTMKTVTCSGKTFALTVDSNSSNPMETFKIYELSKPSFNSRGMKDHTHNVKSMIPSGYDIRRASLRCQNTSLKLSITSFTGGFNKPGGSSSINLLITNSGRVLNIGDEPTYPRRPRRPYFDYR